MITVNGYYVFFKGILYRIVFETSTPESPDQILYAFRQCFDDSEKEAILIERDIYSTTIYNPLPSSIPDNESRNEAIELRVAKVDVHELDTMPLVFLIELYDGRNMILPVANIDS